MIRVALFDLDDTLFAHHKAVRDGITAHMANILPGVDAAAHQDRWDELEEHHYHRYLSGELDYLGQRRARARDFMEPFGVQLRDDREAEDWFAVYFREYVRAWTLFDDALPCLDALAADGIRVGIITNGDKDIQRAKLDAMGLDGRVDHLITSGELGFAKPDSRIFEYACNVFEATPSETAYVGDRLRTDAVGAAAAGLLGVWLNRDGLSSTDEDDAVEASGVRVIRSLAELPGLLA
jgi:putative hydrolase of the HAD superfamily